LEFLASTTGQEKEIKGNQIRKEKVKLSLYTDNMISIPKRPRKNCTKKLLNIINTFSKVAGQKINLQKSVAFLYGNNEQTEKESRKTIPFTVSLKENKTPRNKLNKGKTSTINYKR
jgi:hypothetical protein